MKKGIIFYLLLGLVVLLCAFVLPRHKMLYPIRNNGYFGYMNANKKLVVEAKYINARRSSEGLALAKIAKEYYHCLNNRGKVIFSIEARHIRDYKEGLAAFEKDEKWGFIDRRGNVVIEPQYRYAASFSEGFAAVRSFDKDINESRFYINKNSEMMFDKKFYSCGDFSEGYGVVGKKVDGEGLRYGIIDRNGNIVVPIENRVMMSVSDGLYGVGVFPDPIPPNVEYEEFMGWALVDIATGEIQLEWPTSGLGFSYNGHIRVCVGGKGYGIINMRGETVVAPQFRQLTLYPIEGLYEFQRKGKKHGFMTATGEIVIPAQFDNTDSFYGGLARIVKDGQWGYVDLDGEVIYDKDVFSSE